MELEDRAGRELWCDGYVRTYLERDLQTLASVDNLVDFRRLMRAACLRIGGLLNQTDFTCDVGLPRQTASRYLSLLETSYQVVRPEPYSVNRTKRLVKTPKLLLERHGTRGASGRGLGPLGTVSGEPRPR